jgi:predicted nucleotidyltransferase
MLSIKSDLKSKILNYYLLNEESKVYVNELARMISSDPKNVYRILIKLVADGLLLDEFKGRERYFYSNTKNPLYQHYRNIFLKTAGLESMLRNKFKAIDGVKEAYIFGSFAQNRSNAQSDIDVLLVGSQDSMTVQKFVYPLQKEIKREINVLNITQADLEEKKKKKDQLIESIFSKKTIKIL